MHDERCQACCTAREWAAIHPGRDEHAHHVAGGYMRSCAGVIEQKAYIRVRPDEVSSIQEVEFLRRQGPASQRQLSLALCKVTNMAKRRQSDRQAATRVKRLSLVTGLEQWPTVFLCGKAPVGVGYGNCAGDAAGVGERGMPEDG